MRSIRSLIPCLVFVVLTGCMNNTPSTETTPTVDIKTEAPINTVTGTTAMPSTEPGTDSPLTLSESEFPRIDGSTATIPLGEAIASVIMDKNRGECEQYAQFSGTSEAYKNLANGDTDFLVVYEMPEPTKEYIDRTGVEFESVAIGSDALVFLVNSRNPVNGLTTQQIKDIYSGKITNWTNVGGADGEIKAYQRNSTAGSQALMEKLVMTDTPFMNAPETFIENSMEGLNTAISSYDNGEFAIGYNVYYYVAKMRDDVDIKILEVDGAKPSSDTISVGDYPFVNDFYAVIRKDAAADSPERRLFDWIQGEEGQALINLEGYVVKQR